MPLAFAAAVAGAFGATIGSFLNVVAYRLPRGESLVHPGLALPRAATPRSRPTTTCPCSAWLWLRGRCRSCRIPISPRYPIVEALTAALAVAVVLTKHSAADVVARAGARRRARPDRADRLRSPDHPEQDHAARRRSPRSRSASALDLQGRARAADRRRRRGRVPAGVPARLSARDGHGRRQAGGGARACSWVARWRWRSSSASSRATIVGGARDGARRGREGSQDRRAVRTVPGARRRRRPARRARRSSTGTCTPGSDARCATVPGPRHEPVYRSRPALIVALTVGLALTVTAHNAPAPVAPRQAIRAALRSPRVEQIAAGLALEPIAVDGSDRSQARAGELLRRRPDRRGRSASTGGRTPTQEINYRQASGSVRRLDRLRAGAARRCCAACSC